MPTRAGDQHAARAGAERSSSETQANQHFRRGVELFDQGNFNQALEAFLSSNAAASSIPAQRNAALCLERLQREDEAFELLDRALRVQSRNASAPGLVAMRAARDRLASNLGTLRLTVNVQRARIFVDDRFRGTGELSLRVKPGARSIRVVKDGYLPARTQLVVVPGTVRRLEVQLAATRRARPNATQPGAAQVSKPDRASLLAGLACTGSKPEEASE